MKKLIFEAVSVLYFQKQMHLRCFVKKVLLKHKVGKKKVKVNKSLMNQSASVLRRLLKIYRKTPALEYFF